jgi:hypothetical protein
MIAFVARPGAAPVGDSLADLVAAQLAAGRRGAAQDLLNTRIQYAARDAAGDWVTRLSSLPWLEEKRLRVSFDPAAGLLTTDEDRWRLIDADRSQTSLGARIDGRAEIERSAP